MVKRHGCGSKPASPIWRYYLSIFLVKCEREPLWIPQFLYTVLALHQNWIYVQDTLPSL
jgi:hypothetical protein